MMTDSPTPSARTQAREAFFLTFSKAVRARFPDVHLVVTGGFRSRGGMAAAVQDGACDLIGLGRPSVLDPGLPKNIIFNSEKGDSDKLYTVKMGKSWTEAFTGSRSVGAGLETVSGSLPSIVGRVTDLDFSRLGIANRFGRSWQACEFCINHKRNVRRHFSKTRCL